MVKIGQNDKFQGVKLEERRSQRYNCTFEVSMADFFNQPTLVTTQRGFRPCFACI